MKIESEKWKKVFDKDEINLHEYLEPSKRHHINHIAKSLYDQYCNSVLSPILFNWNLYYNLLASNIETYMLDYTQVPIGGGIDETILDWLFLSDVRPGINNSIEVTLGSSSYEVTQNGEFVISNESYNIPYLYVGNFMKINIIYSYNLIGSDIDSTESIWIEGHCSNFSLDRCRQLTDFKKGNKLVNIYVFNQYNLFHIPRLGSNYDLSIIFHHYNDFKIINMEYNSMDFSKLKLHRFVELDKYLLKNKYPLSIYVTKIPAANDLFLHPILMTIKYFKIKIGVIPNRYFYTYFDKIIYKTIYYF